MLREPKTTFLEVELNCGTRFASLRVSCLSWEVTRHNLLVQRGGQPGEAKLINDQRLVQLHFLLRVCISGLYTTGFLNLGIDILGWL